MIIERLERQADPAEEGCEDRQRFAFNPQPA
ncbi:hypothetical protein GGD61_001120 [Bradyrhizobium sp. SBR1B]|nr:hypothetical protein [Bradyrhizobium sp. SBR1B]